MKALSSAVLVAILSLGASALAHATMLTLGSATVVAGDTATINLDVSGLGNGTALGVYDVVVLFDSNALSFVSATYGDPVLGDQLDLEGHGTFSSTGPAAGTVELFELSLDSPDALLASQASSFTLATLTFATQAVGVSPLSLAIFAMGDQDGASILTSPVYGAITASSPGGATPVPEPSSSWLLLVALAALLGAAGWRYRLLPRAIKR